MSIALCKCGVDMTEHPGIDPLEDDDLGNFDHAFDASGTRHRCDKPVFGLFCPRPRYHDEEGVPCGPLTGHKLWGEGATVLLSDRVDEIEKELFDELARRHKCDRHGGLPCKADQDRARLVLNVFRNWLIENE